MLIGVAAGDGAADGRADGAADGTADGRALGVLPTSDDDPGLSRAMPPTTRTTAMTAAAPSLALVFMKGFLHGARMRTRRCGVDSMVSMAESSSQSGARFGASDA
jgi:hypothetical protein